MSGFDNQSSQQMFELLAQLLAQLSSSDNAIRTAAEEQLNKHWLINQAPALLAGLSYLAAHHQAVEIRSLAPVLLRRIAQRTINDQSYYVVIGDDVRHYVHLQLLEALQKEQQASVRNKMSDAVAELAQHGIENSIEWPQLVQCIDSLSRAPSQSHREAAFRIISGAPGLLVDPETSRQLLSLGITDSVEPVRLAAIKAAVCFLLEADDLIVDALASLVPLMFQMLPSALNSPDSQDGARDALGNLIELAEAHPKLFRPVLQQIVDLLLSSLQNDRIEDSVKQSCLEFLLTYMETAPAAMRRVPQFASSIIPIMLKWMTEHDDDPSWFDTQDLDDVDQEANETVGEQSMDRISRALLGKVVLPLAFAVIPSYLGSTEWQKRHAGLRCISAIGEGCVKHMAGELDKVVSLVLPHLQDEHPRVRHAACNAIGQMCTDFAPKLQLTFHEAIMAHMLPVLNDPHLRVKTYCAAALVNFSEDAQPECIAPYLESIIPRLLELLGSGKLYAQEQAITTLATIADSSGTEFAKYYSHIMPVLLNVLQTADQKEHRSLRGKTMECATLIAMAVGKEVFAPDAQQFIQVLQHTQQSVTDPADPQSSYLLSAWARVCKVLGQDFAPFMSIVLPPLFASAQLKPDIAVFDDDQDTTESEEDGWEVMRLHGQRIGIKTSVLEEKCTAVEMLLCYTKELGPLFHEYVDQTMQLILPLLKFYFHDGVRVASITVIPLLFTSWVKADYPRGKILELWHTVAQRLIETLQGETELSVVGEIYTTIHETLDILGPNSLSEALLRSFVVETSKQLEGLYERANDRNSKLIFFGLLVMITRH